MKSNSSLPGENTLADTAASKNTFFKLTPEVSERLIKCDLSKSEMKLWLYLVAIAPFGDRQYTYSAPQAMLTCGLKKATYFLCKANLQKLELIDFKDGETKFINKLAPVDGANEPKTSTEKIVQKFGQSSTEKIVQKNRLESKNLDSSPKNWTPVQKIGLPEAGNRSEQGSDSLQTIQTDLDSTDNIAVADENFSGEEKEEETTQGVEESGTLPEPLEPTGILEEPLDPITEAQRATMQLLDEREVLNDLRRLGIELNEGVRATMKKHKANVPDAIAHIRQRYDNREKFKNVTGAFVKACQEGAKPRSTTRSQVNPPTIEQLCQLEEAKATGVIRDFYLAPIGSDRSAIMVDTGKGVMCWWEYLSN